MVAKFLLVALAITIVRANGAGEEAELLNDLAKLLENGENSDTSVARAVADAKAEGDIFEGFVNMFASGDKMKTYTTANFADQIACYQGRDEPLWADLLWANDQYNNYGCFCGGGHQFGTPVDATDRCCQTHDYCYDRVTAKYGISAGCQTYTTLYTQTCCRSQKYTKCNDPGPSAGREFCECDQAAARCFAQPGAISSYNKKYRNLRQTSKCGSRGDVWSFIDVIKTCKHLGKPVKQFKQQYGSQGTCPSTKKKSSWW